MLVPFRHVALYLDYMVHYLSLFQTASLIDWIRCYDNIWALLSMLRQILVVIALLVPPKTLRLEPRIDNASHVEGALRVAKARISVPQAPSHIVLASCAVLAESDEAVVSIDRDASTHH